jgi:hypothetical protein
MNQYADDILDIVLSSTRDTVLPFRTAFTDTGSLLMFTSAWAPVDRLVSATR